MKLYEVKATDLYPVEGPPLASWKRVCLASEVDVRIAELMRENVRQAEALALAAEDACIVPELQLRIDLLKEALRDLLESGFDVANTPARQRARELLAEDGFCGDRPDSKCDLTPHERAALTVAWAQVQRGEFPMPACATVCVVALARLAGRVKDEIAVVDCPAPVGTRTATVCGFCGDLNCEDHQ